MNQRMDRKKLNIGTYILQPYARTEKHVRDLAECGIDFVVCMNDDRDTLDLFSKYRVGAIVSGIVPGWWGGDGDNAGKLAETNPLEKYEAAAKRFTDHPAIWGIDIGDEPSALDFPYYGKVADLVDRSFREQFPYLNLYPNYASVAQNNANQTVNQLGTATYAEHIEEYCRNVGSDYICYDFYMYSASVAGAYANLETVASACRRTGRSLWIVLQVNSNRQEEWTSLNRLRFQASSAMAFGAENIIWACYTAGWWHNQVLDGNGEKTEQYDKLKTVNEELHAIAPEYMKYRNTSTHFIGFSEKEQETYRLQGKSISSLSTGVFFGLEEKNGKPFLCGQMTARDGNGKYALYLCAADDPMDRAPSEEEILFSSPRKIFLADAAGKRELLPETDGLYHVRIGSGSGALVEAE